MTIDDFISCDNLCQMVINHNVDTKTEKDKLTENAMDKDDPLPFQYHYILNSLQE